MSNDRISACDAVYAFCAWLTCRPGTLTIGASHVASPMAELAKAWTEANGVPEVSPNYPDNITQPPHPVLASLGSARVVEIPTALAIIEQLIDAVPDQGNDFENGRLSGLYSAKHALEDAAADSASNVPCPTKELPRHSKPTTAEVLHILRNPWGWSEDSIRRVRLIAADVVEAVGTVDVEPVVSRPHPELIEIVEALRKIEGDEDVSAAMGVPGRMFAGVAVGWLRIVADGIERAASSPKMPCPSAGVKAIADERARQVSAEGWTPEHDDEHPSGQLAAAGACYAFAASEQAKGDDTLRRVPTIYWPWSSDWWKPKDQRRNLVRAGALIAAEIDRLDRASSPKEREHKQGCPALGGYGTSDRACICGVEPEVPK